MKLGWWLVVAGGTVIGFLYWKARREANGRIPARPEGGDVTRTGTNGKQAAVDQPQGTAEGTGAATAPIQGSSSTGYTLYLNLNVWPPLERELKSRGISYTSGKVMLPPDRGGREVAWVKVATDRQGDLMAAREASLAMFRK